MIRFCNPWIAGVSCSTLGLLLCAGASLTPPAYADGPPTHWVRGHGIWDLNPPRGLINQISINAWQDESGAHGVATWATDFDPAVIANGGGWVWKIEVTGIGLVSDNTAYVFGTVVSDNKFPEFEGTSIFFEVVDNGNGAADPPDTLLGYEILGGDFTVR